MTNPLRLVTYRSSRGDRLGALVGANVVDLVDCAVDAGAKLPAGMVELIEGGDAALATVRSLLSDESLVAAHAAPIGSVTLLSPIPRPRKNVFCVGRNYLEHIAESARGRGEAVEIPEHVMFFTKPPTAVIGDGAAVEYDAAVSERLDYEVELVLVIGRAGRDIDAGSALSHVWGYTVGNDISARDLQSAHGQWFKGKALDTTCPLGPCIVPAADIADPQDLSITLTVNGETRQDARTSMMIFDIPRIIGELSAGLTLEPGDLIMTGTPSGIGSRMSPPRWLQPGDEIVAEIEGIGVLNNHVTQRTESTRMTA
jgi:2-keto-4-pentenoate hydratase/2-oxohepta-3-ene-1,7-dioic acid hydratase in catechol pathway